MHAIARQSVILGQHVQLDRRRRNHQLAAAIDDQLMLDAFLEVEFLLELVRLLRIVRFHLPLLPHAERMGRVDMRHPERF